MKFLFYESYVLRMKVWNTYEGLVLWIVVHMYEVWFQYLHVRMCIWNYYFNNYTHVRMYEVLILWFICTYVCANNAGFYFWSIHTYEWIYYFNIYYVFLNIYVVFLCVLVNKLMNVLILSGWGHSLSWYSKYYTVPT